MVLLIKTCFGNPYSGKAEKEAVLGCRYVWVWHLFSSLWKLHEELLTALCLQNPSTEKNSI